MTAQKEAATKQRPYEKLVVEIRDRAMLDTTSGDGFDMAADAIDRIFTADSLEAIFDANEKTSTSLKDSPLLGVPLAVWDVQYRKSSEKFTGNGLGVFAIISTYDDSGEPRVLTTGAPNVVASLYTIQTRLKGCSEENPTRLIFKAIDSTNGDLLTVARPPVKSK